MFKRALSLTVIVTFFLTTLCPLPQAHADSILDLPAPGTMVSVSPNFEPALIRGLTVHKDNPFLFDFIVDPGQDVSLRGASLATKQSFKDQADRMIKYFFASLTIPDKDVWVNLSPYEKDRMIPESLGVTAMGRDLLAQDYMLKQLTASLIYPQKALGKTFWDKVYSEAKEKYGTTAIPVNTFNKVWIVPQRVGIYEHGQTAYIVSGHLKVMLEEDYLSMTKHNAIGTSVIARSEATKQSFNNVNALGSQIIRQIVLPEIEKEVNNGKNFATLRQIFYAQALAVWFKRNLKQALLNHVYANKGTVKGIDQNSPTTNEAIYQQYLKAYKKGVFNYIKEDIDPVTQEALPRKYFSGGYGDSAQLVLEPAQLSAGDMAQTANDIDLSVFAARPQDAAMLNRKTVEAVIAGGTAAGFVVAGAMHWIAPFQATLGVHYVGITTLATGIVESTIEFYKGKNAKTIEEKRQYYRKFRGDVLHIAGVVTIILSGTVLAAMHGMNIDSFTLSSLAVLTGSKMGGGKGGFERFADELVMASNNAKDINDAKLKSVENFKGNGWRNFFFNWTDWPVFTTLVLLAYFKPAPAFWNPVPLHHFIEIVKSTNTHLELALPLVAVGIGAFAGAILAKTLDRNKPETSDAAMTIIRLGVSLLALSIFGGGVGLGHYWATHSNIVGISLQEMKQMKLTGINEDIDERVSSTMQIDDVGGKNKVWGRSFTIRLYTSATDPHIFVVNNKREGELLLEALHNSEESNFRYEVADTIPPYPALAIDMLAKLADNQGGSIPADVSSKGVNTFVTYTVDEDWVTRYGNSTSKGNKAMTVKEAVSAYQSALKLYSNSKDSDHWNVLIASRSLLNHLLELQGTLPADRIRIMTNALNAAIDRQVDVIMEERKISQEVHHMEMPLFPDQGLLNKIVESLKQPGMDRATLSKVAKSDWAHGGIDLSQQDSAIRVTKDANGGVQVDVDPALIARVEREGLSEVDPVIINMRPADIQSLFGITALANKTPVISPA